MRDLDALRTEIDALDAQLLALFEQRMQACREVGAYKRAHGLAVLDTAREQQVLDSRMAWLRDDTLMPQARTFMQTMMDMSKQLQAPPAPDCVCAPVAPVRPSPASVPPSPTPDPSPIPTQGTARDPSTHGNSVIAWQGCKGAYGEEAAKRLFPDARAQSPQPTFADVLRAVAQGEADFGVLPIENTSTGMLPEVYDLLEASDCRVVGETRVPVAHCLLGVPGATLADIRHVYSHPQGLMQCARYLSAHPGWQQHDGKNTAMAAALVARCQMKCNAAIASAFAAHTYGLAVLEADIQSRGNNNTRFIAVARRGAVQTSGNRLFLTYRLPHVPGTLREVLVHIARHGVNVTQLHSRPVPDINWAYRFFLEGDGDLSQENVSALLAALGGVCTECRLLGVYTRQV